MASDRYGLLKPAGDTASFRRRSAAFARICPSSPGADDETRIAEARFPGAGQVDDRVGRFEAAYVGHAKPEFRDHGSSGGLVSWVAAELLRKGLVDGVAHVAPIGEPKRLFAYRLSRSEAEVRAGAKSRYYPVELSHVLAEMRATPGRYAVVGVPCFVKAVHLLSREDPVLRERVAFTLGLFCGHMKSARMVDSFAWQMRARPDAVERVEFRVKDPARPANWYTAELGLRNGDATRQDWWHLVDGDWGAGFFQNPACNACDDVVAETADIAFGDAWVEPYSSDGRGTNVVVVRSPLLHRLLEMAIAEDRLDLKPVDSGFVAETQAAGLRQRREGLALRLGWRRAGLRPVKRVRPGAQDLPLRRRLVYAMRAYITAWSHRVFLAARLLHRPGLYIRWARAATAIYQGLAYSRGTAGLAFDRLEQIGSRWRLPASPPRRGAGR
jgi:coenzyme F420-reducing hydrogenase beta subunit